MYRQSWNAPTNQHLFILYIRNDVAAKVTQDCTNSQNFINFRGEVNWNCLRKDFEVFQSAYDPLNMDTYIGNAPSVGGIFFRELHASLGECWNDKFYLPFIEEIGYGEASVCHYFIAWTKIFQEPWICSYEFVTAPSSIRWWDEHDQSTWCNRDQVFNGVLAVVMAVGLASWVKVAWLLKGCLWTVDHTCCIWEMFSETLRHCCLDCLPGKPWYVIPHVFFHDVNPTWNHLAYNGLRNTKPFSKITLQ